MAGEREGYRFDDLITEIGREGSYDAALVGAGLLEIHRSGKYGTIFIPQRLTVPNGRIIQYVQMSSFFPTGDMGLLEFIPDSTTEQQETLRRVLNEQVDASLDDSLDLDQHHVERAVEALRQESLMVAGAFELGKFINGERAVQIIYPLPFLKITRSVELAATLAAGFVRGVA